MGRIAQFKFISVASVMMATALAGCIGDSAEEDINADVKADVDVDVGINITVEDYPMIDVADLMAVYQPFVETYSVRKGNHEDHLGARDELAAMFESYGLEVIRQKFNNGIDQENIIGIKWGANVNEWVIVGGHYDVTTTGGSHDDQTQGAYDDGSGTMLTMMLAEAYANVNTDYTIAFVAFDGEERGLQGSGEVFFSIIEDRFPYSDIKFHGMLNLDMFGLNWPICAPIWFDDNDAELRAHVLASAEAIGIPDDMIKAQGITLGQSDYAHWYNAEARGNLDYHVPTVFFIADFEELAAPGTGGQAGAAGCLPTASGAYPFWHVVDTWETMTAMAGGQANLEAGLQTALDLSSATLAYMVLEAEADQGMGGHQH